MAVNFRDNSLRGGIRFSCHAKSNDGTLFGRGAANEARILRGYDHRRFGSFGMGGGGTEPARNSYGVYVGREDSGTARVSPATAVNAACSMLLGPLGAAFAVLGVVVLPVTSGDTAMRSCRLILADALHLPQQHVGKRLMIALPLFMAVVIISQLDFSVMWRYFGWVNQVLACFTLWSIAVCLRERKRLHWAASVPAAFMTAVCVSYMLESPDCGIMLSAQAGNTLSLLVSMSLILWLLVHRKPRC